MTDNRSVIVLFMGCHSEVDQTAHPKDAKMNKRIVEDFSSGLMNIENVPLIDKGLIAEGPSKDILDHILFTKIKQVKKE